VTDDPARVNAIRDSIVSSIDLPPGLQPQGGMDFSIAGQGMRMAAYSSAAEPDSGRTGTLLMLMQMTIQADEAQMRRELETKMGAQTAINVESTETKSLTIDGQMVDFKFSKGTTNQGAHPVRQVTGVFPGKQGTVMLILLVPESDWNEMQVISMLESIKK
jgi:hypothetical protein